MPSTYTTDPIGPRSVDEMLSVVYTRADGLRRRRNLRRLGVAAVAVLFAGGGLVTLGGDRNAQVRLVDRPDTGIEDEAMAPPAVEATAAPVDGAQVSGSAGATRRSTQEPREIDATVKRPETIPELPVAPASTRALETWADDTDTLHDSTPSDWYFDIATTSMQFDAEAQVVIFRTTYRSPDTALEATRADRVLESRFDYEDQTFVVSIHEADNQLGAVNIDNLFDCTDCSAGFNAAGATVVMTVPLDTLNQAVTRRASELTSGADIMSMEAWTFRANGDVKLGMADTSTMGAG